MATVKLLRLGDEGLGPVELESASDDFECAGIKLNGTLDFNSNQASNLAAADAAGEALVYGQSGGALSGLAISGAALTMGNQQITGLADGSAADHAVTRSQLDTAVTIGGRVKEFLVHDDQIDDAEGVLAAICLYMSANPVSGDTIVLTDGTTTRTYGAGTGGDVQYTIGATAADTMANLAAAIAGDGSAIWGASFSTNLDAINADGVVVITEDDNDGAASSLYGTWATQANCQVIDFGGELDYSKKTSGNMASALPGSTNFGMNRTKTSLTAGEMHAIEESDSVQYWDADAEVWQAMTGSSSIPDATSASGGGTKGKVTVDRDYGLLVSSGILRMSLASNKGLSFDGSGDLQGVADTTAGMEITASGFAIDLAASNPGLQFDGSGDLEALVDGTTISKTGGLNVLGLPSLFTINSVATGATVTAANLDDLTDGSNADTLHTHAGVSAARLESEATAEEALSLADPIEWGTVNGQVRQARANAVARVDAIGVVEESGGISASGTGTVVHYGPCTCLSGATIGTRYFLGDTGGLVTSVASVSAGNHVVFIGTAMSATQLYVNPAYITKKASA